MKDGLTERINSIIERKAVINYDKKARKEISPQLFKSARSVERLISM
jgi:hypothetical protein